jgi:putative restriction endonuclease
VNLRSVTLRRPDLQQGLEPDCGFYLERLERVSEEEIDLLVFPLPDFVVEVEITSPALSKLPIYASLGVPDTSGLRRTAQGVKIFGLAASEYTPNERSEVLPPLTKPVLSDFWSRAGPSDRWRGERWSLTGQREQEQSKSGTRNFKLETANVSFI